MIEQKNKELSFLDNWKDDVSVQDENVESLESVVENNKVTNNDVKETVVENNKDINNESEDEEIEVFDPDDIYINMGRNVIPLNVNNLLIGSYIISVYSEDNTLLNKLQIIKE